MVYAGTDGGFAVSNDAGLTWEPRNIGLVATTPAGSPTPRTEIAAFLPDPASPGTVLLSLLGQGFYITRDDGNRWKPLQSSIGTPWIDSLAVDEQTGRYYAGTDADGVYVSQDGGDEVVPVEQWAVDHLLPFRGDQRDCWSPGMGRCMREPQARGAAVSRDDGATWQRLNSGLPDLDVRHMVEAGRRVFAMTAHRVVRLQTQ